MIVNDRAPDGARFFLTIGMHRVLQVVFDLCNKWYDYKQKSCRIYSNREEVHMGDGYDEGQ